PTPVEGPTKARQNAPATSPAGGATDRASDHFRPAGPTGIEHEPIRPADRRALPASQHRPTAAHPLPDDPGWPEGKRRPQPCRHPRGEVVLFDRWERL